MRSMSSGRGSGRGSNSGSLRPTTAMVGCLSVCPSVCLSICPSVCLSVRPAGCLCRLCSGLGVVQCPFACLPCPVPAFPSLPAPSALPACSLYKSHIHCVFLSRFFKRAVIFLCADSRTLSKPQPCRSFSPTPPPRFTPSACCVSARRINILIWRKIICPYVMQPRPRSVSVATPAWLQPPSLYHATDTPYHHPLTTPLPFAVHPGRRAR